MKRLGIIVTLLLTTLMLTILTFNPLVIVAGKNPPRLPHDGVVPQKSTSSSYQYEIRFSSPLKNAKQNVAAASVTTTKGVKPNVTIVGGGNFISDSSSTISGVKCRFGFVIMEKGNVWVGHGAFNGMKFTINSSIDSEINNDGQTYYGFSGTIGVHYKGNFSIYIFKNQNDLYNVKFQILWKDAQSPLIFYGMNIRGNIVVHNGQ